MNFNLPCRPTRFQPKPRCSSVRARPPRCARNRVEIDSELSVRRTGRRVGYRARAFLRPSCRFARSPRRGPATAVCRSAPDCASRRTGGGGYGAAGAAQPRRVSTARSQGWLTSSALTGTCWLSPPRRVHATKPGQPSARKWPPGLRSSRQEKRTSCSSDWRGEDAVLGAELRSRFNRSRADSSPVPEVARRTVGALLAAAKAFRESGTSARRRGKQPKEKMRTENLAAIARQSP